MNGLMVRKKKYRFQVEVRVEELQHVPFVNQVLFFKVRLLDGGFVSQSNRLMVQDHTVRWNQSFNFSCKMTANASTGELDSCMCRISVRQEVRGGKSFQKLGYADVNLAEFAGSGRSHSYILEAYDSKHRLHNSTLKVTVEMTLLSGDICFKAQSSRGILYQPVPGPSSGEEVPPPSQPTSGSLASLTSSGYDSLTKKAKEEEENLGVDALGHSRNSSNTSHGSQASGYASMTSHSDKSGHVRSSSLGSFGVSDGGSLERPTPSTRVKSTSGDTNKDLVASTRVDATDIVNQLIQHTMEDLKPDDSQEASGLQLYIGRDGTAAVGSKRGQSGVEFKPVVINKR